MPSIKHALANSPLITDHKSTSTDLYNQYYDIFHEMINKHAPVKTKQLTPSSKQHWISANIIYHKQRKRERKNVEETKVVPAQIQSSAAYQQF